MEERIAIFLSPRAGTERGDWHWHHLVTRQAGGPFRTIEEASAHAAQHHPGIPQMHQEWSPERGGWIDVREVIPPKKRVSVHIAQIQVLIDGDDAESAMDALEEALSYAHGHGLVDWAYIRLGKRYSVPQPYGYIVPEDYIEGEFIGEPIEPVDPNIDVAGRPC